MNVSSHYRFEGSVFFIYDHDVLKKEEDLLEDAIIYFYPHTMPLDNQCLLCGQLMGLVRFSDEMFGSSPILYRFKQEKIAVKHVGQYSFALAGSNIEPNSVLLNQLDRLYNLFSFYHGSINRVKAECNNDDEIFRSEMRSLWELYLAYIRNYGDQLPSVFNPVAHLPVNHTQKLCFLKSSHILQSFQRRPNVIAGSILYNRYILCNQLPDSISRCLLLLKPNQHLHPAMPIDPDFPLPYGVRLFSVYIKKEELNYLLKVNDNSPYNTEEVAISNYECCCKRKPNSLPRKIRTHLSKTNKNNTGDEQLSASERDPISSSESSKDNTGKQCRAMLEELLYKGFRCCKCIDDFEGEFDEGSLCDVDSTVNEIGHSVEYLSEVNNSVENDVISEREVYSATSVGESGIEVTCSDFYSSTNTPLDHSVPDEGRSNTHHPQRAGIHGSQVDRMRSQGICDGSQRIEEELHEIEVDKDEHKSYLIEDMPPQGIVECSDGSHDVSMGSEVNDVLSDEVVDEGVTHGSQRYKQGLEGIQDDTRQKLATQVEEGARCDESGSQAISGDQTGKARTPSQSSEGTKNPKGENVGNYLKCCDVDGLVHVNLFVQAHAEIVLILLTNCNLHQKEDVVKSLWNGSLSQIGELDILLRQSEKTIKEIPQAPYNYLVYDNLEKTMTGNFKEPVYSGDLVFCDTAKLLHTHFQNAPQLIDVTLRNLQSGIYGRKTFSKEVYFQEPVNIAHPTQRHQPQNPSGSLESKVQKLLAKNHGIHLV